MAKVVVWRFDEEELCDMNGRAELYFTGARAIARADSADSAVKLLGVSGMRPLNETKHPIISKALREACVHYDLGTPRVFLRGVHGTFVITREPESRRKTDETEATIPIVEPVSVATNVYAGCQ